MNTKMKTLLPEAVQAKLEAENCSNLDMIAEPTAVLLGKILKELDASQEKALYHLI